MSAANINFFEKLLAMPKSNYHKKYPGDWAFDCALRCFAHARDVASFFWVYAVLESYFPNHNHLMWGDLDRSLLSIAIMNENDFAIAMAAHVFAATIDDFGHQGEGGERGLQLAVPYPAVLRAIMTYKPSVATRARVYAIAVARHPDRYSESRKILSEGCLDTAEFVAATRSSAVLSKLADESEALKRAIDLFSPPPEARVEAWARLASTESLINSKGPKHAELLAAGPPETLAAAIEAETLNRAREVIMWAIFEGETSIRPAIMAQVLRLADRAGLRAEVVGAEYTKIPGSAESIRLGRGMIGWAGTEKLAGALAAVATPAEHRELLRGGLASALCAP